MRKNSYGKGSDFSDAQLIKKTADGDQFAFVFLLERYVDLIGAKARKFVGGSSEYDDLFQEGALSLYNAACTYDESKEASFRTYASVCIENRMLSLKRKEKDVRSVENEVLESDLPSPEELVIDRENLAAFYVKMKELLSDKEYSVLTLYLSGCSYDDIALELQLPRKAVDNALQRVRRKLKRAIS